MGKIKELHSKLMLLDFEQLCANVVVSQESQATNMNTDQLWQGERADGTKLPDYSPASVLVFGKPRGPIRLFDSGDFYRGFIFAPKGLPSFPLSLTSIDEKTEELESRYGNEIFGLNKANQKEFAKTYVLPELAKEFLKAVDV